MIAIYRGQLVIIDLKATSKINTELLEIQLAAYLRLLHDLNIDIQEAYCLHLKENAFKFVEIQPNFTLWNDLMAQYDRKS